MAYQKGSRNKSSDKKNKDPLEYYDSPTYQLLTIKEVLKDPYFRFVEYQSALIGKDKK